MPAKKSASGRRKTPPLISQRGIMPHLPAKSPIEYPLPCTPLYGVIRNTYGTPPIPHAPYYFLVLKERFGGNAALLPAVVYGAEVCGCQIENHAWHACPLWLGAREFAAARSKTPALFTLADTLSL